MSHLVADPRGPARGVDHNAVDLDASRYSQASTISSVTLGGESYPIGSTVGTSGLFVIGDPNFGAPKGASPARSSQVTLDQMPGSSSYLISEKYDFEEWNWPVIRFSCLGLLLALMIGLLAAVIALALQAQAACTLDLNWWQGSVIYHVNVPQFYDAEENSLGDLKGIEERLDYISYLGVEIVCLNHFLSYARPGFRELMSFKEVDSRLGTRDDMISLTRAVHTRRMKLLLEIEPVWTSINHDWFQESRIQRAATGNEYKDIYVWRSSVPSSEAYAWTMDPLRNQYYFHLNNSDHPILNWNNQRVAKLLEYELARWLELGVDGFYIRGLEDFYLTGDYTDVSMETYLQGWSKAIKLEGASSEQRVLMVGGEYLSRVATNNAALHTSMLQYVDLVDVRLDNYYSNMSQAIMAQADSALQRWQTSATAWVSFHLGEFSNTDDFSFLPALQLLLMVLPGTPALHAGQEVGEDPYDSSYKGNRIDMIDWNQQGIGVPRPYKQGSILDLLNVESIRNAINLRLNEPTLKADVDGRVTPGNSKSLGYQFIPADENILFLKRFYHKRTTYFYVANLGDSDYTGDWSQQASVGFFLLESTGRDDLYKKNIKYLTIKAGQGILFYIPV